MYENDILRIRQKLTQAHLRLNAPLTEQEVSTFEGDHRVLLPEGYRDFLIHAGNGGAGPYHGLLPLDQWSCAFSLDAKDLPSDYLARPSHLVPDLPNSRSHPADEAYHEGTITVAVDGCGHFTLLVVTGTARGNIVGSDGGFTKPFFYRANGFLHWYETWLDDKLGLRQSPGPWFEFRSA